MVSYEDKIFEIPIKDIEIGERIRKSFPEVDGLAMSLDHKGQLEPIQVLEPIKGQYTLVNGHRRILAAEKIKWKTIKAIRFEDLDEIARLEIELELQVRQEPFSYAEECTALKRLVEMKQNKAINSLGCSRALTQREIAEQIGITESRLSESLRIADTMIEYPGCEVNYSNRHQMLKAIRTQSIGTVMSPSYRSTYEECFVVATTNELLERNPDTSVDLLMIHPSSLTEVDLELVQKKIKYGGQVLVFCEILHLTQWVEKLKSVGFYVRSQPCMWHIKQEETYLPIIWAGKQRETPIRHLKDTFAYQRDGRDPNLTKVKPYNLISYLTKTCTDTGSYVMIGNCEDLDTVRCCIDLGRNVRVCNADALVRERAFLNMEQ